MWGDMRKPYREANSFFGTLFILHDVNSNMLIGAANKRGKSSATLVPVRRMGGSMGCWFNKGNFTGDGGEIAVISSQQRFIRFFLRVRFSETVKIWMYAQSGV